MNNFAIYNTGRYNTAEYNHLAYTTNITLETIYSNALVELGKIKNTPIISLYRYKPSLEININKPIIEFKKNNPNANIKLYSPTLQIGRNKPILR